MLQPTSLNHLVFIRIFLLIEYTALTKSSKIEERLVLDLKILMYQNAGEVLKLKKKKADSDKDMATTLQKLKELSESKDALQQELEELKVAARAMVDIMEIQEGNAAEPLTLAGKLQKVPECFLQYVSMTHSTVHGTRAWVG